jgi:hypothetical protein
MAPTNVTIQDAKGGMKRRKRLPQWVAIAVDYDNCNNKKVSGSDMEDVATATRIGKRQTRPLTDLIERILEEACSNHAYLIGPF